MTIKDLVEQLQRFPNDWKVDLGDRDINAVLPNEKLGTVTLDFLLPEEMENDDDES